MDKKSAFERMITELGRENGEEYIAKSMTLDMREIRMVPDRYKIIALGFIKHEALEEVNEHLKSHGSDQLYARNYLEASLIYAFSNQLSFAKWKTLRKQCNAVLGDRIITERYFQGPSVTVSDLRMYVQAESQGVDRITRNLTRELEQEIRILPQDETSFIRFMEQNQEAFSSVRERTRYYFCKYLLYYIDTKVEQYINAAKFSLGREQALEDLFVLKAMTTLKRKQMSEEEVQKLVESSAISCGNLYDAFNYFYFEYVSNDWMDVLLDYYGGDLRILPDVQKEKLAKSIRKYNPKLHQMSDGEIIEKKWMELKEAEKRMDDMYSLEHPQKKALKNRAGEKSVRKYLKCCSAN